MRIIKATIDYLPQIMLIIKDAKELLRNNGLKQWNTSDGYPNEQTFTDDIIKGICYICLDDNIVCGVCALQKEIDNNYNIIHDGYWLIETDNYLSIHRIAVKKEYYHKNVAKELMSFAINHAKKMNKESIRVDTHKLNLSMQGLLKKCGFIQVGIIYLLRSTEDNERLAFELKL